MGIVDRLPDTTRRQAGLSGNREAERRANVGRERRARNRAQRERRRNRTQAEPTGHQDDQRGSGEELNQSEQVATSDDDDEVEDDGLSQHERDRRLWERAQSVPWADQDHWRPENFNVAPKTNCPIIRLRNMPNRLRGGGGEVEETRKHEDVKSGVKKEDPGRASVGDKGLVIETM